MLAIEELLKIIQETITEDVVKGVVLIIAVSAIAYIAIAGHTIDPAFLAIVSVIVGYYFGRGRTNGTSH